MIYMENYDRILTEAEYRVAKDAPVTFRFLHRNFGSWKRVISRCNTLFPARMAALRAGSGPIEEAPPKIEGTITALQALAMLKASKLEENYEE